MNTLAVINLENTTEEEAKAYTIRNTARAVIFDSENRVALMHVGVYNFHKLPGGGIEQDEDAITGLKRECSEEAGVQIENIQEIGLVTEIKKVHGAIQNSYSYIATIAGDKGLPHFSENEIVNKFELLWVPLEEAESLIAKDGAQNIEGQYISARELAIIRAAKEMTNK